MRRPGHLTAVIVDDDAFSCFHLSDIIQHKTGNVELLATYNSAEDALEPIQRLQPDIVFLDVEMPGGMNGFDMLKKLPSINFDIIFTTAHDYYARSRKQSGGEKKQYRSFPLANGSGKPAQGATG